MEETLDECASSLFEVDENLPAEVEEGPTEYKRTLVEPAPERFIKLVSQLKWRLGEGLGEAIYELGVDDDGSVRGLTEEDLAKSIDTLGRMAAELGCENTLIRTRQGPEGEAAEILVRQLANEEHVPIELRIAVVGNVDSGKSTLVSCLTRGIQDNGRGSARSEVFRHKHEIETGRTSAVSTQIMGFDAKGEPVASPEMRHFIWTEIVERSAKIITFIDLGGHERYLKTTIFGLTGHSPNYVMLSIGSNMGLVGMTKEHLGIALALKLPVYVVITKIDMCPENVLEQTVERLKKVLKHPAVKKTPFFIKTDEDVVSCARIFPNDRVVPIFLVSSVAGTNYPLLRKFLNLLPVPLLDVPRDCSAPLEMSIDDIYSVPGVGTVVAGNVLGGTVVAGGNYLLGPDCFGGFEEVGVKSIHSNKAAARQAFAGQSASLGLKKVKREKVRKGMVVVGRQLQPKACWLFHAEVLVLYHSTTIQVGYEAVVHCLAVRQTARIEEMDTATLRTRDRAIVKFRFMYQPEYLRTGAKFIFREGKTKGTGIVREIVYMDNTEQAQPSTEAKKEGLAKVKKAPKAERQNGNAHVNRTVAAKA